MFRFCSGGVPVGCTTSKRRNFMKTRELWSKILTIVGGIAMLVGGLDPMEGSLLILPGSGLLAVGAYLGQMERCVIASRVWAFILVAIGVAALWGLSMAGGFGGASGRSNWWSLLLLPLLIGWNMTLWGPGSPRWLAWLGIGNGLWFLTLAGLILKGKGPQNLVFVGVIAAVGLVALAGCLYRLKKQ